MKHRLPMCDRADRVAARIFTWFRVGCECCTFWRGVALGMAVTACASVAAFVTWAHWWRG